jgi:hypothetical protein
VQSFGNYPVNAELFSYVESGSNFEKAGAIHASYWATEILRGPVPPGTGEPIDHSAKYAYPSLREYMRPRDEFRERWSRVIIEEFVRNEDLDVRRVAAARVAFVPEAYPEDLRPLVEQALSIAQTHPDTFIRRRVADARQFMFLPPRKKFLARGARGSGT